MALPHVAEDAYGWLQEAADYGRYAEQYPYLDVRELKVGPDEGPGRLARAAHEFIEELSCHQSEEKGAGKPGCPSIHRGTGRQVSRDSRTE